MKPLMRILVLRGATRFKKSFHAYLLSLFSPLRSLVAVSSRVLDSRKDVCTGRLYLRRSQAIQRRRFPAERIKISTIWALILGRVRDS